MLKNRIIAVVILRHGEVVQSVQFRHTNIIHQDPRFAIENFSKWDADEILLIDVSRDTERRELFVRAVESLSKTCFVPLTVGGWIDGSEDINLMLSLGADKTVINTQAFRNPDFIEEASAKFGAQCIVVGIDCRRNEGGGHSVFIDRGREDTGASPEDWACEAERRGAGEIFLTSIDHDGMREGYDLELMKKVASAVSIPVIAFGGASAAEQMARVIREARVDAAAAANMFHYVENSMQKTKKSLREMDVNVRL